MSLAIELVSNAATTLSLGGGLWFLHTKHKHKPIPKSRPNITGVYAWKEIHQGGIQFKCPKCEYTLTWLDAFSKQGAPPICACEEYHYEHFHFQCIGDPKYHCGYKCIVRTADDKD